MKNDFTLINIKLQTMAECQLEKKKNRFSLIDELPHAYYNYNILENIINHNKERKNSFLIILFVEQNEK